MEEEEEEEEDWGYDFAWDTKSSKGKLVSPPKESEPKKDVGKGKDLVKKGSSSPEKIPFD